MTYNFNVREIFMLSVKNIENLVIRTGFLDSDFVVSKVDQYGDLIIATDPDLDFDKLFNKINNFGPLSSKIIDNGTNYFELEDTVYIKTSDRMNHKTKVRYLVSRVFGNIGTEIKAVVVTVDSVINGELKTFQGFRELKEYTNRFVVGE